MSVYNIHRKEVKWQGNVVESRTTKVNGSNTKG